MFEVRKQKKHVRHACTASAIGRKKHKHEGNGRQRMIEKRVGDSEVEGELEK
jgi:hypothetical protein